MLLNIGHDLPVAHPPGEGYLIIAQYLDQGRGPTSAADYGDLQTCFVYHRPTYSSPLKS